MTEIMLVRALREFIAKTVKDIAYQTPSGDRVKAPDVINGFMPPKRDAKDDFPFVLVLPVKGSLEDAFTETEVRIEIGAWSEEYDGYEYAMEIMSRIRTALALMPARTLAGRFVLQDPIGWDLSDEQPYPGWMMTMTTTWQTVSPEAVVEDEVEVYGYLK